MTMQSAIAAVREKYLSLRRFILKLYRVVVLRSVWTWTLFVMLAASLVALAVSRAAYLVANAMPAPLVYLWDHGVLWLYARTEFQYIWWALVVIAVVALCMWVKPWKLHTRGGWRSGKIYFVLTGCALFTLFAVLAWQLQHYVVHSSWVLNQIENLAPMNWQWAHRLLGALRPWWGLIWWTMIVTLLALAMWGYLFAFGLLKNITHRIAAVNQVYIRETRRIIENEPQPLDVIFGTSLYGALVRQSLQPLVRIPRKICQPVLPRARVIPRFFSFFEKSAMVLIHYLSLAWIADRLFAKPYYSMHFEMVLNDLVEREHEMAWQALMEDYVHGALDHYAWDGLFAEDTGEETLYGGADAGQHR